MSLHLYKDHIDDLSVAALGETSGYKAVGRFYLEKRNPFEYDENIIRFSNGAAFDFFDGEDWKQVCNRGTMDFDPLQHLDIPAASYRMGADYSIYLCLTGSGVSIVVSENSTFPAGFNADNSRKIGGFHYGTIRRVTLADGLMIPIDSNGVRFGNTGMRWHDNVVDGIIPNSVWDLRNCPKTPRGGMVKVGDLWVSIYLASAKSPITFMGGPNTGLHVASGELQSRYGQLPVTGAEGMNQFTFSELARLSGMRLPFFTEWLAAAFGNPQGNPQGGAAANDYGWTNGSSRARTGCRVDGTTGEHDPIAGIKPFAVSAYNAVDCVGNVREWLSDYTIRQDSTSWNWFDVIGEGMGQAELPNSSGISALNAGGLWSNGPMAGPRTVNFFNQPWARSSNVGARLACDAA